LQTGVKIQPVFISVDPERDTPAKVKEYVKEFHPRMLGLTGDLESVKQVSKLYRVYFSKTGESKTDYLVDHSIIHYFINPEGEFVTFYAKSYTADNLATSMSENVRQWKASHPDYHPNLKMA
jgi:protein SCO1/2